MSKKVRIRDYVYDADWQPIVLILSSEGEGTRQGGRPECHKLFLLPRGTAAEPLDSTTASTEGGPPQTRNRNARRSVS